MRRDAALEEAQQLALHEPRHAAALLRPRELADVVPVGGDAEPTGWLTSTQA